MITTVDANAVSQQSTASSALGGIDTGDGKPAIRKSCRKRRNSSSVSEDFPLFSEANHRDLSLTGNVRFTHRFG